MAISPEVASRPPAAAQFADPAQLAIAFPVLPLDCIEEVKEHGEIKHFMKGDLLWEAGQYNPYMYVVLEGGIEIKDVRTGEYIASHRKGQFSGDIDLLSGRPSLVSAYAESDSEYVLVPAERVKSVLSESPEDSEIIFRAFVMRRALLIEMTGSGRSTIGVQVMGSRFCPDTLRVREFLARNRIPQTWKDLEDDADTQKMLMEFDVKEEETPVVMLPNGKMLRAPSNGELAKLLGLKHEVETQLFDLVIVGAGPAGLAAAVYGGSEGLKTLLIDEDSPGGQAGTSSRIENYMGFPMGISGQDLTDKALVQAGKFGAEIMRASPAMTMAVLLGMKFSA